MPEKDCPNGWVPSEITKDGIVFKFPEDGRPLKEGDTLTVHQRMEYDVTDGHLIRACAKIEDGKKKV
ncbi:MAG TPA: hypothetical protein PKM50_09655 [Methanoregula sp.]|nr:hypothetical protein [Methanoregula sp.]